MIFAILAILAHVFAFNYHSGETFSYVYETNVNTTTGTDPETAFTMTLNINSNATFQVQSTVSDGVYMQLTFSNVVIVITDGEKSETIGPDPSLDELIGAPLFFKYRKNGTITDVISSKKDPQELVNMKLSAAYALRTNIQADLEADYEEAVVIDPMGKHVEYTTIGQRGNSITVETFYSDSDFVGFSDRNIEQGELSLDSQSVHVIEEDKIVSASSITTLVLCRNGKNHGKHGGGGHHRSNDEEEEEIENVPITVAGTSTLTGYTQMEDSNSLNDELTSAPKFLRMNKNFALVANLRDSFYSSPTFSQMEKVVAAGIGCSSVLSLCQSKSGSYTGGSTNLGFKASASCIVGVEKGCKSTKRSYIAGAYATVDIYIYGHTVNAVNAYAEYGQLNGATQRNAVSVSLFGNSVYSKQLSGLDCKTKTINVYNNSKSASYTYSIPVYCVTLQLTAGIKVNLKADVIFQLCVNQFTASVTFKPSAGVTLSGKVSASVTIAKASLELTGTISDYLDPKAYVDGNVCKIGIIAKNYLSSLDIKLQAYYEILDWTKIWSKEEKYRSGTKWNLYQASIGGRTDTLVDLSWS